MTDVAAPRTWVLADDAAVRDGLTSALEEAGAEVAWAGPPDSAPWPSPRSSEARQPGPELVVLSVEGGAPDAAAELLAGARERLPDVPLVAWPADGLPATLPSAPAECPPTPDAAGLLVALARCAPWIAVRRARDAARDEATLARRSAALLREPDADGLPERVLGELCLAAGAVAGALWLVDDAGRWILRAARERLPGSAPGVLAPDPDARALLEAGRPWRADAGALWVPLSVRGEPLAVAQLDAAPGTAFDESAEHAVAALGSVAADALLAARRVRSLQRLALRDPDSSAYNLAYFTDYASKEIDKARRYGRGFSLLVFALDGLVAVRARAGADAARAAIRAVTRALGRVLRESDVLAKVSEQEFLLLLPETDAFGAQVFLRRALMAVRESAELRPLEGLAPLQLEGGAASFPRDGEDFDVLSGACRARLTLRRASLQRKLALEPLGFWESVELLLGSPDGPRLPVDDEADPSRRGRVPEPLFDEVQAEVGRALLREPTARSLVYLGGPELGAGLPLARALDRADADFLPRVVVLGRRVELPGRPGLTPVSLAGDERLLRHEFLLWLHGATAYALLQRRGRGATWAFHTSDAALVDGLVGKLQSAYDLQPY